jgi:LAO/AO transport system kinase
LIVLITFSSAGYDRVIVESVGLGQSEVDIDAAVDMLLLVLPPSGGDGLQAAKKGIMEAADLVIINKADGDLLTSARHTKADYAGAMQFIRQKHHDWTAKVHMVSAHTGFNMDVVDNEITKFHCLMIANGNLHRKRVLQATHWMMGHFRKSVLSHAEGNDAVARKMSEIMPLLERGRLTPRAAASLSFAAYLHSTTGAADSKLRQRQRADDHVSS